MKILMRALLSASLLTACLMAQRPFGVLTSSSGPDPATLVQHRVDRLTNLLSLTTAQAAQATTIFTNAQSAIAPIETNLSTYRTSMHAAVKSNATATIDQLAAQIGTATGQITALQNKADAAFYAILTTDQQAKLDSSGGRGFGGGPRGRPGPPPQ
jgi:Spy/CpxP family protein refolding chaperone